MRHLSKCSLFLIIGIFSAVMLGITTPAKAGGREFIVTSLADNGNGTLRQAILDINRIGFSADAPAIVRFQIDAPLPQVIALESALPEITEAVIIDGEAQCATGDTPSTMRVVLDGAAVLAGDGLLLDANASHSQILGLSIINFAEGAAIYVDGADNVGIQCNQIVGNGLSGIFVEGTYAIIAQNLVAGNGEMGILIDGADNITVTGNFVGTDITGNSANPNALSGVYMRDSANITIEGRNIISGNTQMGVLVRSSNAVIVRDNYIGTDPTGSFAIPNGFSGVGVSEGSFDVTIGGELGVNSNVISGNTQIGVRISDDGTRDITLIGNFIGTDPTGTVAIPNLLSGVYIRAGALDNIIGTGVYNQRNIISGNGQSGVVMNSTLGNVVSGNFIGVDINGTYAIGNSFSGISLENVAADNLIGGDFAGAGNIISGNRELGIYLTDSGTDNNRIYGNFIGVDITGAYAVGNEFSGIGIFGGATNVFVGGLSLSERNLISGNGQFGIAISGEGSSGLTIQNNYIGTDYNGEVAIPNLFGGVVIERGAQNVTIGGDTPEARNLISGNSFSGVAVRNVGSGDVTIYGNFIGSDISGQLPLPNGVNGVRINDLASDVRVGDEERGTGNLIAFNSSHGMYVDNVTEVIIEGNAILSNSGAGVYFPNGVRGVEVGRNDFKRNCENPPSDMTACEDMVGD